MIKLKGAGLRDEKLANFIRMIQVSIPQRSLEFINADTIIEINQERKVTKIETNNYFF